MNSINKLRMIVTDLDGTLLRNDGTVSKETRIFLTNFQKNGGYVVFATSRHPQECKEIASLILIKGKGFVIASDGQYICDYECNRVKSFPYVSKELVDKFVKAEEGNQITVITDGIDYVIREKKVLKDYLIEILIWIENKKQKRVVVSRQEFERLSCNIEKIIVFGTREDINNYTFRYEKIGNNRYSILWKEIDKYYGIVSLANKLQIDFDQIAVFGNDTNDIAMLSSISNSFAVKNATEEAKKAASMVIGSNQEDGVLQLLKSKEVMVNGF